MDKFDKCFKYYEKAIEGRNFHYQNYNTWVNYYSIFNGALFVGYYSLLQEKSSFLLFFITLLGFISAFCWHSTVKGHYIWMISWINVVHKYEEELNKISTNDEKYYVYSVYTRPSENFLLKQNISTQKLTSVFTLIVSIVWSVILIREICKFDWIKNLNVVKKYLIFLVIGVVCCIGILFLISLILKSDISGMKNKMNGKGLLVIDKKLKEKLSKIFDVCNSTSSYIQFKTEKTENLSNEIHYEYIDSCLRFDIEISDKNDRVKLKELLEEENFFKNNKLNFQDFGYGQICILRENISSEKELIKYANKYIKKIDNVLKKVNLKKNIVINKNLCLLNINYTKSLFIDIQDFLLEIFNFLKDKTLQIENKQNNKDIKFDFDDSDISTFNFLSENIFNYLAVFLYSSSEKLIKRFLCIDSQFFMNFEKLKKDFKSKLNFELTSPKSYKAFDELRTINNCIKHSGVVDKNLSKKQSPNRRWKKNEKIILTESDVKYFYNCIADFFEDLINKFSEENNFSLPKI